MNSGYKALVWSIIRGRYGLSSAKWNALQPETRLIYWKMAEDEIRSTIKFRRFQWYQKNKNRIDAANRAWAKNNPDKRRAIGRAWYHRDARARGVPVKINHRKEVTARYRAWTRARKAVSRGGWPT